MIKLLLELVSERSMLDNCDSDKQMSMFNYECGRLPLKMSLFLSHASQKNCRVNYVIQNSAQ